MSEKSVYYFSIILITITYNVNGLTINNELQIIKSDCFERMAIGQRLAAKTIYKTSHVKTVAECQQACTKEKEFCKSLSFGIGVKGNATCELSPDGIKETADLKPIGTRAETDYDLYIKKLDCTLVIDKTSQKITTKPPSQNGYGHQPPTSSFNQLKPIKIEHFAPSPQPNVQYGSVTTPQPAYGGPPNHSDSFEHVQTLVSVSTGPNRPILHPVHEILVGDLPPPQNYEPNKPPFRPDSLHYPYSDGYTQYRPEIDPDRYDRPYPEKYGSYIPRPEDYERPRPGVGEYWGPGHDYDARPDFVPPRPGFPHYYRPNQDSYHLPPPNDGYHHPSINNFNNYDKLQRPYYSAPHKPINNYDKPSSSLPNYPSRPPLSNEYQISPNQVNNYEKPGQQNGYFYPSAPSGSNNYDKPSHNPQLDYLFNKSGDQYASGLSKPVHQEHNNNYGRPSNASNKPKPIVSQSVGMYGQSITSIITELDNACFRRVLAGKRVTRALVKKSIFCERVEDCQRECSDETRFACEGFNYRLDPSGRGKGECELLGIPLSHLDIGRDLYPDPDYDYYERDRNAASVNCKSGTVPRPPRPPSYGYDDYDRRYDRPRPPPQYYDHWDRNDNYNRFGNRRPSYDDYDYDRPNAPPIRGGNRRGDFAYSTNNHHHHHYIPPPQHYPSHNRPPFGHYDHKSYQPYLPTPPRPRPPPIYNEEKNIIKFHVNKVWDRNDVAPWAHYGGSYGTSHKPQDYDRRNYYLPPPKSDGNRDWGQYGGSYGNGGGAAGVNLHYNGYGHSQSFDFWGLNKFEEKLHNNYGPGLPPPAPVYGAPKPPSGHYLPDWKPQLGADDFYSNAILPAEPRLPHYDFIKDECSLRSATGFRLNKGIVKKFFAVPNIYECELLCFKESQFPCASYAFRYTISVTTPTDNCFLSNRNYKELDHYTDLQPDRDFDIYTMNNQKRCQQPMVKSRETSECFWRVRSGQRIEHKVVRDSLNVKSIVECQIECLRSTRFTCRAFSFRYGSPIIGGPIDNCQLTDWPYYELDPKIHFVPEPGFEVYERGSYGHGCEPDHFGIRGKPWLNRGSRTDQLCFIGFGSPAILGHQATRKEIQTPTEEDCKAECTKLRQTAVFQCMSISYSTRKTKQWEPNCRMSDILQRDLLPNVDYGPDEDAWLFAWDNYNPECRMPPSEHHYFNENEPEGHGRFGHGHSLSPLDTWRVYSVSGRPCKRGTTCQENRQAGFWYCELEGGEHHAWDYCCRPDHQCGFSEHFHYPWCYVGPERTQWRKCNDRYFPYAENYIDRFDQAPIRPSGPRPDRPPAPPRRPPPRPSLDEYESQFESEFLDPPKPGGFGRGRHWPLSYLHKEMPPNATLPAAAMTRSEPTQTPKNNPKFAAIENLIQVIKSNDLKNVQYQITNESNKDDDILFVKIPLPGNFTQKSGKFVGEESDKNKTVLPTVESSGSVKNNAKRSQKQLPMEGPRLVPVYRRSYVTRTNVTSANRPISGFKK